MKSKKHTGQIGDFRSEKQIRNVGANRYDSKVMAKKLWPELVEVVKETRLRL